MKQQIVLNDERSTQLVFREFRNTARVARNSVSEEIAEISRRPGATFDDIAQLASGERGRERVLGAGLMEEGLWWAGQAQGLIDSVVTCHELVSGIVDEATRIIGETLAATLTDPKGS